MELVHRYGHKPDFFHDFLSIFTQVYSGILIERRTHFRIGICVEEEWTSYWIFSILHGFLRGVYPINLQGFNGFIYKT